MRPRARRSGLVIRELPGEIVVYDRESHQAHCLNQTAALVFRNADGERTQAELASLLAAECGSEASEDIVAAALETLSQARLLENPGASTTGVTSRRDALRRVGLGAAALVPVVTSLLVPTPAEAANTCIPAAACTTYNLQPCHQGDPDNQCATLKCRGAGASNCY